MESSDHGLGATQELAQLVAPILGWSADDIAREVIDYEKYIAAEMAAIA